MANKKRVKTDTTHPIIAHWYNVVNGQFFSRRFRTIGNAMCFARTKVDGSLVKSCTVFKPAERENMPYEFVASVPERKKPIDIVLVAEVAE